MTDAARRAERAEAAALRELAAVPSWIWDGQSLPVPIESIAENHYGLLVEPQHSLAQFAVGAEAHVSGVLLTARGLILVDALEAARAPGRRRFTIAHELGHLVLHDARVGPRLDRLASSVRADGAGGVAGGTFPAALDYPPEELEANQFAAAMLMPATLLERAGLSSSVELAAWCGVSGAAAEKRLEYLCWRHSGAVVVDFRSRAH